MVVSAQATVRPHLAERNTKYRTSPKNADKTGIRAAHTLWKSLPEYHGLDHPLSALIKAWLLRPVEADRRATAIIPATLSSVRDVVKTPDALFDLADYDEATGFTPHSELQAHLPGLAPVGPEIISPLPLLIWDSSTEGSPRRGKGAPLALRSWIEPVLSLPTAERFGIRTVEIAWGDFTNWRPQRKTPH